MSQELKAGKVGELEDGAMKAIPAAPEEILLAMVGDSYYAVSNRCPHMKGKLAQGTLEGTVVTCPLHGSQFDLKDGKVVRWLRGTGVLSRVGRALKAPKNLKTYPVQVRDDQLFIEI
ncbi:MAG: Rieske 2Fe-2S domain-containing protein [Dehalococcoidia bacterium]|jgi:3-phenylpropionate/trans-cinnamate dioxygenase ferredoxin subunit